MRASVLYNVHGPFVHHGHELLPILFERVVRAVDNEPPALFVYELCVECRHDAGI